jgi:hypothetical protein
MLMTCPYASARGVRRLAGSSTQGLSVSAVMRSWLWSELNCVQAVDISGLLSRESEFQAVQMAVVASVSRSRILVGQSAAAVPGSELLLDDLFDVLGVSASRSRGRMIASSGTNFSEAFSWTPTGSSWNRISS